MKITHNGKRYDTDNCETIAERDHHNNGNYAGTTRLEVAKDGTMILHTSANGQDLHLSTRAWVVDKAEAREAIEWMEMDEDQEARAVELGLIEIVE